ncbi:MAG: GerMN domain-containing protein [Oscillospiraceae bacterium]|nr:GerMN domain-containing protein [Bacillota bacterium]
MSKRWPGLLLSLCLLIGCFGCGRQMAADQPKSPMKFYYKTVDARYGEGQGATGYELREVYGHESDYVWILTEYLQGPVSQELVAPFQRSVSVVSAERVGTQLQLCMSEELANLSGVDLTLACACITWTCLECSGVESVSIRAVGRQLDGKEEIVLNRTHFLMEDSSANLVNAPYTLYFSDTDNRYLIGEEITVGREQEDLPVFLVRQLIGGPTEPGLAETMPLGTTLLGLSVTEGICAVDLSGEFLTNAPQTALAQRMTILSLTNTLTQLDDVDSVVLYAEGQPLTQYGMMDLSQPLTYEEGAIGPVRKSLNEFDADLYLAVGDSGLLSQVPVRIHQTASEMPPELVVQALLAYTSQNGYRSVIPAGTTLRSVRQEGTQYVVDLSAEFLSGERDTLYLAVRSVVATVLGLGDGTAVRITVEGATPAEDAGDWFSEQVWNDSWFFL